MLPEVVGDRERSENDVMNFLHVTREADSLRRVETKAHANHHLAPSPLTLHKITAFSESFSWKKTRFPNPGYSVPRTWR